MPRERSRVPFDRRIRLRVELLEDRSVPAVFTPAQIRHAYGFDNITFSNGSIVGNGAGQTIAIVDAYDDPFIFSDLHHFDQTFGLPDAPSFVKARQVGAVADAGWAGEIALDVEWAHAIAPGANLLLVEARSSNLSDLLSAVDYAASQPGVSAVSMSWGASEFSSERALDSHFATPAGHRGVTFVAAAGDDGGLPGWPAVSPNVLSVGGTSLHLTSSGNYSSETGWSDSGGGVSRYETIPGFQTLVGTGSTTRRTNPDVSYDADPNTGVYVYDSFNGGWYAVGGTSAGAPQWAALVAIADEGRAVAGKGSLDGASQTLYALYRMAQASETAYFHDQTSGTNGFAAKSGYDDVTGIGSPIANRVVASLVNWNGIGVTGSSAVKSVSISAPRTAIRAAPHALTQSVSAPSPELPVLLPQSILTGIPAATSLVLMPVSPPVALDPISPLLSGTGAIFGPQPTALPTVLLAESPEVRRGTQDDMPAIPQDDAMTFDWGWPIGPWKANPSGEAKPPAGDGGTGDVSTEPSTLPFDGDESAVSGGESDGDGDE